MGLREKATGLENTKGETCLEKGYSKKECSEGKEGESRQKKQPVNPRNNMEE